MKKQELIQLIVVFVGGILFNVLFFMERLALNLLIYSIFILVTLLLNNTIAKTKRFYLYGSLHLLASLLVIYNQSNLCLFAWYTSLGIFIGFTYWPLMRTVFFAIGATAIQGILAPKTFFQQVAVVEIGNFSIKPLFKVFGYIVIPIILLCIFGMLYSFANPIFGNYLETVVNFISNSMSEMLAFIFGDFSFTRLLHLIFGLWITSMLLLYSRYDDLQKLELSFVEKLFRKKTKQKSIIISANGTKLYRSQKDEKLLGLKNENIIGAISFLALNILILFLNLIELSSLLSDSEGANFDHAEKLHEGTTSLIMSIIMAMIVILYFFRGNLNFYRKNKIIVTLTYIWIIQNTFLVASVFIRDFNYIDTYGLTYKRIGVIIFLLLCLVGLATVHIKVAYQKTLFYLLKVNGLAWYVILLVSCLINWDVFIVEHNISHAKNGVIDVKYMLTLSDKTLPSLDKNRLLLEENLEIVDTALTNELKTNRSENIDKILNLRIGWFHERWENTSWLSLNYRDWQTHKYLTQKN